LDRQVLLSFYLKGLSGSEPHFCVSSPAETWNPVQAARNGFVFGNRANRGTNISIAFLQGSGYFISALLREQLCMAGVSSKNLPVIGEL
jgi:hypothetical protein